MAATTDALAEVLAGFHPDPDDLVHAVRAVIRDDVLAAIASADYANDFEQHLAALKQWRDTGEPINRWYPQEVLELSSSGDCRNSGRGERESMVSLFASAALLQADARSPGQARDPFRCIAVLLDTIPTDYPELSRRALGAISCLALQRRASDPERVVLVFGILLLSVAAGTECVPSAHVESLLDWIEEEDARLLEEGLYSAKAWKKWILGHSWWTSGRGEAWYRLTSAILENPSEAYPENLRKRLIDTRARASGSSS